MREQVFEHVIRKAIFNFLRVMAEHIETLMVNFRKITVRGIDIVLPDQPGNHRTSLGMLRTPLFKFK